MRVGDRRYGFRAIRPAASLGASVAERLVLISRIDKPQDLLVQGFMPNSSRREFLAAGIGAWRGRGTGSRRFARRALGADVERGFGADPRAQSHTRRTDRGGLARIQTYNPKINAWITVMRGKALAQARELEKEQASGRLRSPLHGIPIGLKDSIDIAGVRTTAASAVYEYNFPAEDAEVVRRLKAAGAILIGKCNMHEFDAGATSAVSYWGPVRNPWNLERISGGSSGGSAAAVAMENCYAALGTDSGGALRNPAAHCGVVGFKATHGRVSMRGIVPFAWSLDHCGPIARTVEDAAMVLQQIAGYDAVDIDCIDRPVPDYSAALGAAVAQFRIGVRRAVLRSSGRRSGTRGGRGTGAVNRLTRGSHEVSLPSLLHAAVGAEVAAFHEGLRGVNGGGYEPSTARLFPATPERHAAADYIRGWRALELVRRTVDEDVFQKQNVDVLVAAPRGARPPQSRRNWRRLLRAEDAAVAAERTRQPRLRAEAVERPRRWWRRRCAQCAAPRAGRPRREYARVQWLRPAGISVPCGFTKGRLPIGLQIAGPRFAEGKVLALGTRLRTGHGMAQTPSAAQPDTKVPVLRRRRPSRPAGSPAIPCR